MNSFTWVLLAVGLTLVLVTLHLLKTNKITTKFALIWFMPSLVILAVALFPSVVQTITHLFGFMTMSNFMVGILFAVLFYIIMTLTVIVNKLNKQIVLLIQEISMLKQKEHDDTSKSKEDNT